MSLKDLFGNASEKVISSKQLQDLYQQAESEGYLEELLEDKQRYEPSVDFSDPSNFAIYGSAERYYVDAIINIYQNYPYDGSKKEKQEWRNNSSQIDNYIFDSIYPKTTGYISLSGSNISVVSNYRSASFGQYVYVKGGPNQSAKGTFETANIYDLQTNRESNLGITQEGNTVEFWFKDNVVSGSAFSQAKYSLFDLWNGKQASEAGYTRLTITKKNSSSENKFLLTYRSGSFGITEQEIDYNFDAYNWHHYAFSFANHGNSLADLEICLYVDGNLVKKDIVTNGGGISLANNADLRAYIGAFITDISATDSSYDGLGSSFGSYDEFRFWKTCRSSRQIYRNWFTSVGGGSNTDEANTSLGVYFKFNEGIIDSSNINTLDSLCLDYSGRVSNATIINYNINCRSIDSAINIYFDEDNLEKPDPIIFSSNALVQDILSQYKELGFQYDVLNTSAVYKKIPSWITEEADKDNYPDLQRLVQIICSYFDTLHLQISKLSSIKNIEYTSTGEKPKPFYSNILFSHGFDNIEIFNNSTFLEDVLSRTEKSEFEDKISNVKNTIYQNIYNNLSYIYKSKGTEKSFRNLIRSFGIDNELIKINLYANNAEYDFANKYEYTSINKKFVDFNNFNRNAGSIIQKNKSGDLNTKGYIYGDAFGKLDYAPITIQAEVIFPKKSSNESLNFYTTDFTDVSLFGCHTADDDQNDLSWYNNDNFNFQVYAIKPDDNSLDVSFKIIANLSGSSHVLETKTYKNVYDNQKWNFAVRIKPQKLGYLHTSSGSLETDYLLEFSGYNSLLDTEVEDTFNLTASVPMADAQSSLRENKRIYVGAHYQNYSSSSLLSKTDVKISSIRFWLDYLTNEELQAHSYDASNYGTTYPNWRPEFLNEDLIITKADTLLLKWTFDNVVSTDINGEFIVEDTTSGSLERVNDYGLSWLGEKIGYQNPGYGFGFAPEDSQIVNKEYIYSAKIATPEVFNGSDMVQTPDTDDFIREKTPKPLSFYFSIEKSMAQVINDEILSWFATIKNFNNLVGQPNQRYKKEYSDLVHLRKLFFEKINNEPEYEKFLEFYKWIDSSISMMIGQLAPASSNIPNKVRNIVENTLLDRNKYENKIANIKYQDTTKVIAGAAQAYSYLEQKAPSSPAGRLWYKQRAVRTQELQSGVETITTPLEPQNDIDREVIRQVINYSSHGADLKLYDNVTNTFYNGKSDLNKAFNKHYSFSADKLLILEGKIAVNNISNISSNNTFRFAGDIAASSSTNQIIDPFNSNYAIAATPVLFDIETSSSYIGVRKNAKSFYKYKNPYEYFQTSGRTTNNKSFVDLEGNIFLEYSINDLNIVERRLPDRNTESGKPRKTIFVERFSAPGGPEVNGRGMLDPVAEEYSVYNGLNNRNLRVRGILDDWMRESGSISSDFPSYHKIIKNVVRYPGDEVGSYINEQSDNGFISHAIPRSDAQYSWITASMSGNDLYSGYDSEYDNLTKNYQFLSSSNLLIANFDTPVNFAKYNYYFILDYYNAVLDLTRTRQGYFKLISDTSSNTISYNINTNASALFTSPISESNAELNVYLNNLNGPYGYPSWKQIRNAENPIVKLNAKNNNITVQDTPKQRLAPTKDGYLIPYVDKRLDTFKAFKEPPIEYNLPMKHSIEVCGSNNLIDIVSTYDNNKNKFANSDLMSATGEIARQEKQTHDVLLSLASGQYKPEPKIYNATYEKFIYPSRNHVGLKETRTRPQYTEEAGTGSNGYDRNTAEIRTFWRDSLANRKRTNAFNSQNKTGSLNSLNIGQLSASATSSGYTGYIRHDSSLVYKPQLTASKIYSEYYDSVNAMDNSNSYSVTNVSGNNYTQNIFTIQSSIMGDLAGFDEVEARNFLAAQSGTYYLQEITTSNKTELVEYFRYDPAYNFVRPKPSYAYKIHYPGITSFFTEYYYNTDIEPAYTESNKNYYYRQFVNEGILYKTNILAGKNPWYDSYEDFFEDIKGLSIKGTILPEFNFSENSDYYIKEKTVNDLPPENYISFKGSDANVNTINNAYNITDKLDNFIINDLDGNKKIRISIDGVKKLLPYKGFYPQERTVQLVDLFQKSFFNISMNDITGGYPTTLGIEDPGFPLPPQKESSLGSPAVQQIQALLQPLFAPGILFNTIKSGLAIDWPTYEYEYIKYNSFGTSGPIKIPNYISASFNSSNNDSAVIFTSGNYSTRIPFEALLDLKNFSKDQQKYITYLDPTRANKETFDVNIIYGEVLPAIDTRKNPIFNFNNINAKKTENQNFFDDRYQLAINNFLAETPKFFLQNQQLTSFTSGKKAHELSFIAGKTYEMDLVIQKEKDVEMFLDNSLSFPYYYVSESSGIVTSSVKIPAASLFGPPSQFFNTSTGSELLYAHKAYDAPAYAPYVPPYYFGPQYMKLTFTPTGSGNISYEEIIAQITASCYYLENSEFNNIFSSSANSLGAIEFNDIGEKINNLSTTTAYINRMPLYSSIKYDVIIQNNTTKYSLNGDIVDITENSDTSNNKWRIQTKFETPILNFKTPLNQSISLSNTKTSVFTTGKLITNGIDRTSHYNSVTNFGFTGMWGGYAQTGSNSGVSLKLIPGTKSDTTEDLASACGFEAETETKYIGQIASEKEISEAVLMIPFTYGENNPGKRTVDNTKAFTIKQINGENNKTTSNNTNGPYYFAIDKQTIIDLLKEQNVNIDIFDSKITYQDIRNILSNISANNSILKMMKLMTEYVIPPHLNWLFNRTIEPFVMYIFEFKHKLYGDELADIWQGVMPRSAMQAEKDNVTIEHPLSEKEFFHGRKLPDDMQWKVFKAKRRANYKYESLVDGKDQRFDFKPGNDKQDPVYSYNWPYDYFSLVELVNIKASLEVERIEAEPQQQIINPLEIVKVLQEPNSQNALKKLEDNFSRKRKK